jgi:hypothetical protein
MMSRMDWLCGARLRRHVHGCHAFEAAEGPLLDQGVDLLLQLGLGAQEVEVHALRDSGPIGVLLTDAVFLVAIQVHLPEFPHLDVGAELAHVGVIQAPGFCGIAHDRGLRRRHVCSHPSARWTRAISVPAERDHSLLLINEVRCRPRLCENSFRVARIAAYASPGRHVVYENPRNRRTRVILATV